ncbi:hypothetical protein [Candidatus Cyanaurora vandensis]|uniref:hypothetical protein n=1 Tax=Candidatus Cyanaurora vandensis TaxID=2714958 RepID=UPI0025802536|nr:hypothetical protein [Candidatus Cyanaurora vandensis]
MAYWSWFVVIAFGVIPAVAAQEEVFSRRAVDLQIDKELVRTSPVLKRWLTSPPDLLNEIDNTPAFPARLQLILATVPSRSGDTEWSASLQDIFIANGPVSLSTEYGQSLYTDNRQWGAHARFYLLPLGSQLNIAPVVGYRSLVVDGLAFRGPELGTRWVLTAPQAADISFSQSLVLSEQGLPVGRIQLSFGYAISPLLRLSAQVQWQNSALRYDTSYGFSLEVIRD